jgi:serine/threonine protein kinase
MLDDRYEILALLAEGGMGAVYRARRTLLGDEVAIKIVRADQGGSGLRDRFFRESRASARLRHPHIVSILDFNLDNEDRPFLVMEFLNGQSIKDELAAKGRMTVEEVQAIVPSLCSALQFAHDVGFVHRDLKPANIVAHEFAPGQRVYKVVDFGIANLRDTDETRLTGPHEFLGTIAYASPEQLKGDTVDPRSDVYSLGAVVFEMLTGKAPFAGPDPMAILSAHLNDPVPRLSEALTGAPAWIDLAVSRALAKDPADRWATIADFGHALRAGPGGSTTAIRGGPTQGGLLATYDLGERIGRGRLGSVV